MTFAWPLALFGLAAVPIVIACYILMLRRRKRYAVRYSSLSLIRAAVPSRAAWRRHLPFALLMAAVASLCVSFARPDIEREVPSSGTTVMLALDVSTSMCATDVEPNRLSAAQAAAQAFVEEQRDGARIGIVAFSGTAQIVVPPTTDTDQLTAAIAGFTTSRGTAIGSATLRSVDAIANVNPDVGAAGVEIPEAERPLADSDEYQPEIVVLLTDGAVSAGIDPIDAAQQAADRRIRMYTIGFGSDDPQSLSCTAAQMGADGLNGGFEVTSDQFEQFRQFIVIDEEALQSMADITGGEYFRARDAEQLSDVFRSLPEVVETQTEQREISIWFSIIGTVLAVAALALSIRWNRTY